MVSHKLHIRSCPNVRELGGFDTPEGPTLTHRFLRAGGTRSLMARDLRRLRRYGVRHVIDLRSIGESPRFTCAFSRMKWVSWTNVPLFDVDISAPALVPVRQVDNYLVTSYLSMLATKPAIRAFFVACAQATDDECVLFHCAAGMDRTGMASMLLLGLAGVSREQIIADYAYSFAPTDVVDAAVASWLEAPKPVSPGQHDYILHVRIEAVAAVYDTLMGEHGSTRAYLRSCGISDETLDTVRTHLLGSSRP